MGLDYCNLWFGGYWSYVPCEATNAIRGNRPLPHGRGPHSCISQRGGGEQYWKLISVPATESFMLKKEAADA